MVALHRPLCQPPQRRPVSRPRLLHRTAYLKAPHHSSDLVTDGDSEPPVVGVPSFGCYDVPGEMARVQGLRRGFQSRFAEREQVGPLHRFRGAVVGSSRPSLGCYGIVETDHRDDVEKVGASFRQPGVQAVDLGFDLRSLEQELGDDEGRGRAPSSQTVAFSGKWQFRSLLPNTERLGGTSELRIAHASWPCVDALDG